MRTCQRNDAMLPQRSLPRACSTGTNWSGKRLEWRWRWLASFHRDPMTHMLSENIAFKTSFCITFWRFSWLKEGRGWDFKWREKMCTEVCKFLNCVQMCNQFNCGRVFLSVNRDLGNGWSSFWWCTSDDLHFFFRPLSNNSQRLRLQGCLSLFCCRLHFP